MKEESYGRMPDPPVRNRWHCDACRFRQGCKALFQCEGCEKSGEASPGLLCHGVARHLPSVESRQPRKWPGASAFAYDDQVGRPNAPIFHDLAPSWADCRLAKFGVALEAGENGD